MLGPALHGRACAMAPGDKPRLAGGFAQRAAGGVLRRGRAALGAAILWA